MNPHRSIRRSYLTHKPPFWGREAGRKTAGFYILKGKATAQACIISVLPDSTSESSRGRGWFSSAPAGGEVQTPLRSCRTGEIFGARRAFGRTTDPLDEMLWH